MSLGDARRVSDEHDSHTLAEDVLRAPAKPYPKSTQLARAERRHHRRVASPQGWQRIADAKQGPCRVTGTPPPNELHHIVARAHGGADTASNIVPLSRAAHDLVTRRDPLACYALLASLTDAEYAYMIDVGGEDYPERAYGLEYGRGGAAG